MCMGTTKHQEELLATMSERLQQMSIALNTISEQQLISDRAKTVAYREKDRDEAGETSLNGRSPASIAAGA